jgi:hypothetical protein
MKGNTKERTNRCFEMVRRQVYQYKSGNKTVIVYDDDSVEEHTEEEKGDIVSSICPDCMKIECICGRKK